MFEDFMNALQNFRRNKTRTLLSLLGVIIGVASVIVITSLGESSTKQIQGTFGSAGLDVVTIRSGFMRKKKDPNYVKFDEAFRTLLFDNVKNIKQIWFKNTLSATLSYGETSVSTDCAAVETDYLNIYNMKLSKGTFFFCYRQRRRRSKNHNKQRNRRCPISCWQRNRKINFVNHK